MENCDAEIDREVNCVIDQILREDRLESLNLNPCPDSCEASCAGETFETPGKNCAIETSARFSIRILEALKAIQRQKSNDTWASCSMKEVVQYIRRHYYYDGDLCSQVETALNQVTVEGFVLKIGANRYHLVGPFASVLNPSTRSNCDLNRSNCGSRRRRKRRRPGTAAAMSSCRDSAVSHAEDHPRNDCRNRNNWNESFLRAADRSQPFNEDHELSIIRGMNPDASFNEPIQRPGGDFGGNRDEFNPPIPQQPLRRPGGGGIAIRDRGNVGEMNPVALNESIGRAEFQDRSSDEDMGENQNPVPANEAIRRYGNCGGPDHLPSENSSDENMFRVEPAVNVSARRRSRRRSGRCRRRDASSSSDNQISAGCSRRRSRKTRYTRHSAIDSSDDTDHEDDGEKPWVENCQAQESRSLSRCDRKCTT